MSNEDLNELIDEWEGSWNAGTGWKSLLYVSLVISILLLAVAIW